ncbi:MAG: universal stress protein [Solirubrobacterales bacterium]|nr:universal stress protein [Solirubrobacterales bacterium]
MTDRSDAGPILIAYDGSDCSKDAIAEAGRQLRDDRSAIVLTVWEPLDAVPFWGVPMATMPSEMTEQVVTRAREVAAEGVALIGEAGFEAEPRVELGAPVWSRIVETADEVGASVIVLGSHGRSSVGYAVMGSVATAVAHHAKVPVLITRESRA